MKRIVLFIIIIGISSEACKAKKITYKAPVSTNLHKSKDSVTAPLQKLSAQEYIEKYKYIAIAEMKKFGVPASITLAQGLLESSNGNSTLARIANNHFGIKCPGGWNGDAIYQDDDAPNECFRAYLNPEDSFKDHSDFLKTKKRYSFLFEYAISDYVSWANGLKQAGYATNPQYPQLLIMLIERYKLYEYDPEGKKLTKEEDPFFTESELEAIINMILPMPNNQAATFYKIKTGDTLFSIAKRFRLTIAELKTINKITNVEIKVGQELKVNKD